MSKIKYFFLFIIFLNIFTGCVNEKKTEHEIIEVKAGNNIIINTDDITAKATYYNYIVDNITIQIFAVKSSDEKIKTLFNTCSSCNPSPDSYFIQINNEFECQNCKSRFSTDEIGINNNYGCSPIAILDENKTSDENKITILFNYVEMYKDKFELINIYKNMEEV